MIVQKDFLNKLRDFGLNSYESKIWTALLSRGVSTAGELSDIANVPRSRSYDVLESLEKKGFIIMKIGKPIKYIAVHPAEVVERVKKRLKEESDKQAEIFDQLKKSEVLSELQTLHTQGLDLIDPATISGAIKGRNNLHTHFESIIKNASSSIVLLTTEEGILRKAEALNSPLKKASNRGVKIKIAAPITKKTRQIISTLPNKCEIRNADKMHGRFCIIDGKEIFFMITDDKEVHPTYDLGIWITSPFFAATMANMFDLVWQGMVPVGK